MINRFSLIFFSLLLLPGLVTAQDLVINEYYNDADTGNEWVEIATLTEIDLRGNSLIDFNDSGQPSGSLTFSENELWSAVPPGTILLIYGNSASFSPDTDASDGILKISASNSSYFDGSAPQVTSSLDAFVLTDPDGNQRFGLGHGSGSSGQVGSPGVHKSTTLPEGSSIGFFYTQEQSNLNNNLYVKVFDAATPAEGNDERNASFFEDLRPIDTSKPQMDILYNGESLQEDDVLLFNRPVAATQQQKTLKITNGGNETLVISDIETTVPQFSSSFSGTLEIELEDTVSVQVFLNPDGETQYEGDLVINSNDDNQPEWILNLLTQKELNREDRFEVVTWNIEWFGSSSFGPDDEDKQLNSAIRILDSLRADLYALQEITGRDHLDDLVNGMEGNYEGMIAGYIGQSQKMAYIYNTKTITPLSSGSFSDDEYAWAGRLPFSLQMEVNFSGETQTVRVLNVHAKAFSDKDSYERRKDAAMALYEHLQDNNADENIIFLGDYNDDVDESTYNNEPTPYAPFIDDTVNFKVVSQSLTEAGQRSYAFDNDMIDHITISNELFDEYIEGSESVFNDVESFIRNYRYDTSDHYPVWSFFDFNTYTNISDEELLAGRHPKRIELGQNFPNPFNPSTQIRFTLPKANKVTLKVYSVLGQELATLADGERFTSGSHTVKLDAGEWSSGIYFYRLSTADGFSQTRSMSLVK